MKLGIIGCGGIVHNYLPAFQDQTFKSITVTVLVDSNLASAELLKHHFPHARCSKDINQKVLNDADAFIIATPNHLHYKHGMQCLSQRKHVLMEKPLANRLSECQQLIKLGEKNHCVFLVGFCMRFNDLMLKFKSLIDRKILGEIFNLSIWTEQLTQFEKNHWHCKKETLGGGQLFSHGCHYIDILQWILGEPVEGYFIGSNKGTSWMEAEGSSHVILKFSNEVTAHYFGTWGARGTRNGYLMQAHCEQGLLELNLTSGSIRQYTRGTSEDKKQFYTGFTRQKTIYQTEIEISCMYKNILIHFIDCILNGTTPSVPAKESLKSMTIIKQLYTQGMLRTETSDSIV